MTKHNFALIKAMNIYSDKEKITHKPVKEAKFN